MAFIAHGWGWVQALAVVGGMVFALGVMHSKLDSLEQTVKSVGVYSLQMERVKTRVSQITQIQDSYNGSMAKLAEAVNKLSISVAKLQVQMDNTK